MNVPGRVEVVSCNLHLITNPIVVKSPYMAGAKLLALHGQTPCLVVKVKRWGGPKTGNVHTAAKYRMLKKRKSARW